LSEKQGFVGVAVLGAFVGVAVGEWVGVAVGAFVEGVVVGERVLGVASMMHALVICPAYAAKQQPRWVV
jgi:fatty-acid desaturase